MDAASRSAFYAGIGREGIRSFYYYLRDALKCEGLYGRVANAIAGPFRALPLLTIFGEYNDPLGFQPVERTSS